MDVAPVQEAAARVRENVGRVIVGKESVVDLLLVSLLAQGHVLLEDVPGIGKTTLAKSLARSLGASFQRIQFTPDLLPSDVTGVNVYNQRSGEFEFRPGPVMSQLVLADEINRASPRTQSALLEVMQEGQVTVDGITRPVPRPFLVLATQNPIELEGTFPLPEAQIDRFLMRLELGYPNLEEERAIIRRFRTEDPYEDLEPVLSAQEVLELSRVCREVYLHPVVEDYLLELVRRTRQDETLALGASPRGSLALMRTSQALAALRGRDYVQPDDLQELAVPVLAHRLIPSMRTRLRGRAGREIVSEILAQVPVPVEEDWSAEVAG
ncbi:MAG: MoxR family ATPase [Anaerolineae bacterium]|nr:MoxR family ATPase [Anaerolineae bacterium]